MKHAVKSNQHVCPIAKTAALMSDTWTMLIMRDLLSGTKGFCELERSLVGISTRTLTIKLKQLEHDKMIRKNRAGLYEATAKGRGLRTVENAMRRFGERFL